MGIADYVSIAISIAGAASPTVQGLNTGLVAAYHNHYPDRVRVYSTASVLTQMVSDGFRVNEGAYKAAAVYASQPQTPAQLCIGRRALPPQQSVQLTLTDGTVNDAYAFTIVGSDGVSHGIAYTNVVNPGPAIPGTALTGTATVTLNSTTVTFSGAQTLAAGTLLTFSSQPGVSYSVAAATSASTTATVTSVYTGATTAGVTTTPGATTSVTNGSTAVTFSQAQTLLKGAILSFASQPGVYYALSANVTSSTSGTLTAAYNGTTNAATNTQALAPLSGTFAATNGSSSVPTTSSQVGTVAVGDSVEFSSQLGTYYTVAALTSSTLTLTTPYSGSTQGTANAADVCQVSAAAAAVQFQLSILSNIGTPSVAGAVVTVARTDGQLNDFQGWVSNGFANVQLQDNTADPGIATDLAAIQSANVGAWYALMLDSNSRAEILASMAWLESTGTGGKVGFFNNSDYGNTQTSVSTDVFSQAQLLTYKRSYLEHNSSKLLCYAGAAACSTILAANAGSLSLAFKSHAGVPADTDTTLPEGQAMAINSQTASTPGNGGKCGNYYKQVAGQNWAFPGTTPGGQYMDITIGLDYLAVHVQADVAGVLASLPKTPFTDFGIGLVKDAIFYRLTQMAGPSFNFILPNGADPARPIVVTVPTAASLSSAQRASRNLPGTSFSAGLQGAINTAGVQGTLVP